MNLPKYKQKVFGGGISVIDCKYVDLSTIKSEWDEFIANCITDPIVGEEMDLEQNELNKFTIWFSDIRRYAIDNMVIDFRDCLQPNLNYQF